MQANAFGRFWVALAGLVMSVGAMGCPTCKMAISEEEKSAFLKARPEEGGYVINGGDSLQVEVWQNPQLTRTVTVRPDGKITLPLVQDVAAAGNTVPQFQRKLTDALKTYLKDPLVSITMTGFTSKQIYVEGQVRTAAAVTYNGEMYLLQAIALSGGPTPFADGCAIVVRKKGNQFVRYSVALEPLLSGKDLKENIPLLPNDVLTVQ